MSYICHLVLKVATAILFLAFFGQTFNQGFYCLAYLVNKAAYAKNCENKYRPELHCNGKCQLMKKIEEQEKRERQQAPELKLASKAEALSSRSSFPVNPLVFTAIPARQFAVADEGTPTDRSSSFFHPPDVLHS